MAVMATSTGPVRLVPRGDRRAPLAFKQGAHPPYAIRWYGATSLFGHFRNLVATAIASESVDSRDWMRPLRAEKMLRGVLRVLGLENKGTLLESLERPLWIDWVADTGDDRDVSQAVGRMLFAEYEVDERDGAGPPLRLPRGDVLLFGGDTAYPVATAEEIYRRVVQPWNELLRELPDDREGARVLLGIPGNHDWYDGLDGFGRFFRRQARSSERSDGRSLRPEKTRSAKRSRKVGLVARGLHLDEVGGTLKMIADAAKAVRAFWRGTNVGRRRRLTLQGYEAVQESSYWALPLAPGLDLWGADRQLGRLDYRQRGYFQERRREVGEETAVFFVAGDPALAFGERWEPGAKMLAACKLSFDRDRILYLCGDMHHYERRAAGAGAESLHVIAGGGGAFLHGTSIARPPMGYGACAYPDAAQSRALALQVPLKLMLGRAGYLVHIAAAFVASIELGAGWHNRARFEASSAIVTLAIIALLYVYAGHQKAHPRRVLALAIPFGVVLGLMPMALASAMHSLAHAVPLLGRDTIDIVIYAFVAAFVFGVFLTMVAVGGLEMQQAFTALGHPGFKHFVRLRVSPDGTVDAWTIGKDDPLAADGPWLVDRWTFSARRPGSGP
jgi:hypothetical protein